jgi:hypothetical protein
MKVSHSRVPHLNAEWEFSVNSILRTRFFLEMFLTSFFCVWSLFDVLGMGLDALSGYFPQRFEGCGNATEGPA